MTTRGNASSLTKWAARVVCVVVLGLAGWGVQTAYTDVKGDVKAADAKAQKALDEQAKERTDVAVLKKEIEHVGEKVDELKGMVKQLLDRRERGR
jgi:peptidoglycan hydrolase CwlO-like protein